MSQTSDSSAPAVPSAPPAVPEAAGDLLRRLAGCLAHHVNNSLTGVIGYLELALRELSPRAPAASHLQASLECAFQAAEAVKRIVNFACRPEVPTLVEPLSLGTLVEQVVQRLQAQSHPALIVEAFVTGPAWVRAGETTLQAAVRQVLDNALEAMPEGGRLQLRVEQSDGWCRLIVTDSGGGIPPEILPHLFEPFHTTKSASHLGLGLVHCRELMQLLGGQVEVESIAGQGATVTLTLPALPAEETKHRDNGAGHAKDTPADASDRTCCAL